MNNYLVIPMDLLGKLSLNEVLILSQCCYMKKRFNTITASNQFFSDKLSISISTVSRTIDRLAQLEYIKIKYFNQDKLTRRIIFVSQEVLDLFEVKSPQNQPKRITRAKSKVLEQFLAS